MGKKRVVVTGLGLVTPVGNNVDSSWESILAGKSGIGPISTFDVSEYSTRFGGGIKDFEITEYLSKKEARKMDTFIHYGMAAGIQAFNDSGLEVTEENAPRIGVAIGSGIGGLDGIEKCRDTVLNRGPKKNLSFLYPQ